MTVDHLRTPRPDFEAAPNPIRVVDLFSGCGGLTVGVAQAGMEFGRGLQVALAIDFEKSATAAYAAAFPSARVESAPVENFFDGELGEAPTDTESALAEALEHTDILVGGPPCQGHSNLNNRSRRNDARNAYYARMARAALVLRPTAILVENVPTVVHDADRVVDVTITALEDLGYGVATRVAELVELGVPQRRKRHVLLAVRDREPAEVEKWLGAALEPSHLATATLRDAIHDLLPAEGTSKHDTPSRISARNIERINYLFDEGKDDLPDELRPPCHRDGNHSYKSVYGRLSWDAPAQTLTTGFTSMGQGRYVHPERRRTLTPHEAARIQGLPDWMPFEDVGRTAVAKLIGNAVPPALSRAITATLLESGVLTVAPSGATADEGGA